MKQKTEAPDTTAATPAAESSLVEEMKQSQATRGQKITDADIMSGGPVDSIPAAGESEPAVGAQTEGVSDKASSPASEQAPSVTQSDTEKSTKSDSTQAGDTKTKPYRLGAREFASADELLSYTAELERRHVEAEAYRKGLIDAVTPAEVPEVEPNIEELLFEDPKRALELQRKQILAEIAAIEREKESKTRAEVAKTDAWKQFYDAHPDLREFREIVDMQLDQIVRQHGDVPLEKGIPMLVDRSRAYLNKLRTNANPGTQLPSEPAVTSGSGGAPVPRTAVEEVATDFVTELRRFQRK